NRIEDVVRSEVERVRGRIELDDSRNRATNRISVPVDLHELHDAIAARRPRFALDRFAEGDCEAESVLWKRQLRRRNHFRNLWIGVIGRREARADRNAELVIPKVLKIAGNLNAIESVALEGVALSGRRRDIHLEGHEHALVRLQRRLLREE